MIDACSKKGCKDSATFAIYAMGYPAAMYIACDQHVGALLQMDMGYGGSTNEWIVRPKQ